MQKTLKLLSSQPFVWLMLSRQMPSRSFRHSPMAPYKEAPREIWKTFGSVATTKHFGGLPRTYSYNGCPRRKKSSPPLMAEGDIISRKQLRDEFPSCLELRILYCSGLATPIVEHATNGVHEDREGQGTRPGSATAKNHASLPRSCAPRRPGAPTGQKKTQTIW